MHIYCKKRKKHTCNTFPEGKSKFAIFLTRRTSIDEIKEEYDLERELEVYLQFFTD